MSNAELLVAQVRSMADAIRHRGPDDAGEWADGDSGIALGFRRLAILDLSSAGHQPMQSPSGRFSIVFNGEIYNHRALRRELQGQGYLFRGHGDTEVVCAGFEAWGVEATLRKLQGMFAIAAWDGERRCLSLARDRLGIKPLFVHQGADFVSFGSELKALQAGPSFDAVIDPAAVRAFLQWLYVPAPASIFAKTKKLLPGHLFELTEPGASIRTSRPFWSLDDAVRDGAPSRRGTFGEAHVDQLEALLLETVSSHLESDVPLGAFLSGGIDSSLVVSLAQRLTKGAVKTFSIGFDEGEHDESRAAASIAAHLKTDHRTIQLSPKAALPLIPELASTYDEPFADPSALPAMLVCRAAREHVAVALSGDGGDELFGGYNRYVYGQQLFPSLERIPRWLRASAGALLGLPGNERWDRAYGMARRMLPSMSSERLVGEKMRKLSRVMAEASSADMYGRMIAVWDAAELLPSSSAATGDNPFGPMYLDGPGMDGLSLAERMMLCDQSGSLMDDQLAKVDRASMASSLEVRVPLLDHRVAEFSWQLPAEGKISGGVSKVALRKVLDRYVPRSLMDRPKTGFSVPLASWLRGPLHAWAADLLTAPNRVVEEQIGRKAIDAQWRRLQQGDDSAALRVWTVLMLASWTARWSAR